MLEFGILDRHSHEAAGFYTYAQRNSSESFLNESCLELRSPVLTLTFALGC